MSFLLVKNKFICKSKNVVHNTCYNLRKRYHIDFSQKSPEITIMVPKIYNVYIF